jgi:predicted transposase YdaD
MPELTLESLAKRVEALEIALAAKGPNGRAKDWRRVIGMFRDSEFMREVDEECQRMREAEREAARQEDAPE